MKVNELIARLVNMVCDNEKILEMEIYCDCVQAERCDKTTDIWVVDEDDVVVIQCE